MDHSLYSKGSTVCLPRLESSRTLLALLNLAEKDHTVFDPIFVVNTLSLPTASNTLPDGSVPGSAIDYLMRLVGAAPDLLVLSQ